MTTTHRWLGPQIVVQQNHKDAFCCKRNLSPADARSLAAELVRLADECEPRFYIEAYSLGFGIKHATWRVFDRGAQRTGSPEWRCSFRTEHAARTYVAKLEAGDVD